MLGLCTIRFLPEVSLKARLAFMQYAPLMAAFYHWVFGTMFIYIFATLLGNCHQIMRSGAMWFIKDPQNQNMHPIRDILERPTCPTRCADIHSIITAVRVETEGTVVDCSVQPGAHASHPSLRRSSLPTSNSCSTDWYHLMEVAFKEAFRPVVHIWNHGKEGSTNNDVAIVRGVQLTVEVTEGEQSINEVEARLPKLRNAEAE
ncbi:hypothetical protein BDM02DRAFT_3132794 [Thelephora ganbajun]|uniref:Uncharacterized protein n=1 Tax=Thelephora ganbajun TaxID=370292 RepID=A0ACB6YZQ1_THEGA|nr:hypothetical protein BDM02DRAFT_3132794 [Thelephora ganbajun]